MSVAAVANTSAAQSCQTPQRPLWHFSQYQHVKSIEHVELDCDAKQSAMIIFRKGTATCNQAETVQSRAQTVTALNSWNVRENDEKTSVIKSTGLFQTKRDLFNTFSFIMIEGCKNIPWLVYLFLCPSCESCLKIRLPWAYYWSAMSPLCI